MVESVRRRSAAFVDRDGTIIEYKPLLSRIQDVAVRPGAAAAIRRLNAAGVLAIVVTNQPVVAHGICSMRDVEAMHAFIDQELRREGASIDGWYVCPHHDDSSYAGRRPDLCVECGCRKPARGLVDQATSDFEIDLPTSAMFGDSWRDQQLAANVGIPAYLLDSRNSKFATGIELYESLEAAVGTWLAKGRHQTVP